MAATRIDNEVKQALKEFEQLVNSESAQMQKHDNEEIRVEEVPAQNVLIEEEVYEIEQ